MATAVKDLDVQSRQSFSPKEFAQLKGLSLSTVHRYLKAGKLPYSQPGGRGHRILIPVGALQLVIETIQANMTSKTDLSQVILQKPQNANAPGLSGPSPKWTREARPR
jgi:hypothetical protein